LRLIERLDREGEVDYPVDDDGRFHPPTLRPRQDLRPRDGMTRRTDSCYTCSLGSSVSKRASCSANSSRTSDGLAAGVSVFQLARVMGTSVRMIERHYGTLLDGSGVEIAGRVDALDADRQRDDEARSEDH
jgi:hypothetical protein